MIRLKKSIKTLILQKNIYILLLNISYCYKLIIILIVIVILAIDSGHLIVSLYRLLKYLIEKNLFSSEISF